MFNPRQPRDTGGQWVRIGRGELEQMIDALVQPRAAHIAEINGKPGTAHRKVVARDIKARILKPIKVAPTYHVKVRETGVGARVEVNAKGTDQVVRANIPHVKADGNVDVTARRAGAPAPDRIVNKAQAGEGGVSAPRGGETAAAKERLQKAAGTRVTGLTDVAKRVAGKEREKRRPPATTRGGKTEQLREIEAAVAGKAIKKAQADRLRALVTLHPPGPDGQDPAEYWGEVGRKVLRRGGQGKKANLDAIQAMKGHLGVGEGGASGNNQLHSELAKMIMLVPGAKREAARKLFLNAGGKPNPMKGENLYEFVARVRRDNKGMLGDDPELLRGIRAIRQAAHDNFGGRAAAAVQERPRHGGGKFGGKGQSLPAGEAWLHKEPQNVKFLRTASVGVVFKGKIDGKDVFIKPEAGGVDIQIHDGIPVGHDAERERAGWLVGQAMGMDNLAPVVVKDMPGIQGKAQADDGLMRLARRGVANGGKSWDDNGGERVVLQGGVGAKDVRDLMGLMPKTPQAEKDKRRNALFDAVIGNFDRHKGNIRVDDNRIYPIDQGLAFPERDDSRGGWNHQFLERYWGVPLNSEEERILNELLDNPALFKALREDAGLPASAVERVRNRIRYMLYHGTFITHKAMDGREAN